MNSIEPLIQLSELQTTLMKEVTAEGRSPVYSNYDQRLDTVTMLYVQPGRETFVYYIEGDIALVCDMESLEIVGFQIEAFAKHFLPRSANDELEKSHASLRIPEFA